MPISTRRAWTKPSNALLLAVLGAAGLFPTNLPADQGGARDGAAPWLALGDPHLDVIPRTDAEAARIAAVTAWPEDFSAAWPFEANAGGAGTVAVRGGPDDFSQPAANLTEGQGLDFHSGDALFGRLWVSPPASTIASDGLGPLYNARSCQRCHPNDGRGHPPEGADDSAVSMVLEVAVPTGAAALAELDRYIAGTYPTAPDPTYGRQLQEFSLAGHPAEYRLEVSYEEIELPLSGGESATLRRPTYTAADLGYGPLHPDAVLSPRIAPQMIGLGLLEAIPAQDILAWADPEDGDGDGISGRAQVVWSAEYDQPMLGRFGHKAGIATIREQVSDAFAHDIGISSPLFPAGYGDCTARQDSCIGAVHGGDAGQSGFEIDAVGIDLVTFYSRSLAVPSRRNVDDPGVLRGRKIFYQIGCASCHRPNYVTHRLASENPASFQLIWPYSDLLLHDMGEGLADNRPEGRANGREWRTAPLWGIGLTETVSGHTNFLHDGRARSLLEAVLWHGGEAEAARDAVIDMPPQDRAALIEFLESL
ncbi:c-type cytochrome [Maritalea mobilis]|uniref:di-heme oxidoreductase family protein n=1 Tax=Maritalea mobilis TaxID=483324 RepID=UPI001C986115|nr:di-heme oxidoredictase family protein [Maritalea mobilis]MBY6202808.1 c-type cytochrome [Maritalea mobilis]